METPLKRKPSEVEAELKLALMESGLNVSSSLLEPFFSRIEPSVTVEKLARWFISTRALRSELSRRKSSLIEQITEQSEANPVELEETVHVRLQKAGGVDINSTDFSWKNLVSLHSTEHASETEAEESTPASLEVNVNSGGIVYFAVFQQENGKEGAACLKFTPSRLTTQSERLGYEIVRHMGVTTPQARIIRSDSEEWSQIVEATEEVKLKVPEDEERVKTCDEMLEALEINRCLLLMGYIAGCPLHKYKHSNFTQPVAQKIAGALGRVLLADLVLRNEDRLPSQKLGWRGNTGNLLCTEKPPIQDPVQMRKLELKLSGRGIPPVGKEKKSVADDLHIGGTPSAAVYLVAIDSGVPRRPPFHKREFDKSQFPGFVEMLLNDLETAAEVLSEVSGGYFDAQETTFDRIKITNAFRCGARAAFRDMLLLRNFLLKLQRRLDFHLKQFVADVSESLPADWSPDKTSSPASAHSSSPSTREKISPQSSSPSTGEKISPQSKLERRFTLQLKDFNKLAKVDDGVHDKVEHWDEVVNSEGYKLCQAHGFVTGFLEGTGSHSVVDSYELKIRLEHILERMEFITLGAETERPSQVLESLFVGSALASKSLHVLKHIGVTHILCLCPIEVGPPEPEFLQSFSYKSFQVLDIEEEDIARHFKETCEFIEEAEQAGGKTLVHCFEGKSRSVTIVLAYLMIKKNLKLQDAWNLVKGVHPRSQPNDAFMKTLGKLDKELHGESSMEWQKRKPVARLCPVCEKNVGVSSDSLQVHLQKHHPEFSSTHSQTLQTSKSSMPH